ncbi:MAG: hypothetical protein MJ137_05810 [Clostridia bacterium]|nr:hypothetical protein [Clostridia bacterium]
MKKIKIRFNWKKAVKAACEVMLWIALNLSVWKVLKLIEKIEQRNKRKERIKKAFHIFIASAAGIFTASAITYGVLKHLKKIKGGYLFNIFDREKYDIIENGSEDGLDLAIRDELSASGNDGHKSKGGADSRMNGDSFSIPVDEDASEKDFDK